MYKIFYALTILSLVILTACETTTKQPQKEKTIEDLKKEGGITNADLVRNPISAKGPKDTVNIPKIVFAEEVFDFGEVLEGEVVEHTFTFTNEGKMPLVINNATSTCGCTIPKWTKEPIGPGETGELNVKFDTKKKTGKQSKPITINTNAFPSVVRVHVKGKVIAQDK